MFYSILSLFHYKGYMYIYRHTGYIWRVIKTIPRLKGVYPFRQIHKQVSLERNPWGRNINKSGNWLVYVSAWVGYVLNWLVYVFAWVGYVLNWLVYVSLERNHWGRNINKSVNWLFYVSAWVGYVLNWLVYVSAWVSYVLNGPVYVSAWVGYVSNWLLIMYLPQNGFGSNLTGLCFFLINVLKQLKIKG